MHVRTVSLCDGILSASGQVCCHSICGDQCGGGGCSGLPGGSANCCGGNIINSRLNCADNAAPCVMYDVDDDADGSSSASDSEPDDISLFAMDELYEGEGVGEWTLWDSLNIMAIIVLIVAVCVCCYALSKRRRDSAGRKVVILMDDEVAESQ